MLISNQVRPAGTWNGAGSADTVVLDFDGRHRRRVAMTGKGGVAFLLDLPQTTALREGDGLVLSDGRIVRVNAAPEPLMEITAPDLATVVRIAWHLGNRHVPAQLAQDRLRIRHDHVMMEMAVDLGGAVAEIEAPFDPEAGASAHGAHEHHHGATEAHAHSHEHGHHQHPHGH